MAAIDVVKTRIVKAGLGVVVADAIAAAITSAGYVLVPQPGGEQAAIVAATAPVRQRVPCSGGALGSVQVCTSAVGSAGWWLWREHWNAFEQHVVGDGIFVPGASGVDVESATGLTGAGDDIQAAAVTGGLSATDSGAGVAMIAASGYAVQPTGGGTIESTLPAAEVERRTAPGTGGRLQLVAVTLGTAGWALWSERAEPIGVTLGAMSFLARPSGHVGGPWEISE